MRFLLDVNAGAAIADWLTGNGHDVTLVSSKDERMKDLAILEWAEQEKRIIITTNADFEEMIWREKRTQRIALQKKFRIRMPL